MNARKASTRLLSFLLAFCMVFGMLPVTALNADAAEGTVIDAAVFGSDVHKNSSTVKSILTGIKNADSTFSPSTISFVGDTQMSSATVTSAAQQVYSSATCLYAYGSHDSDNGVNSGISNASGLLYSGNYYVYTISDANMRAEAGATDDNVASAITNFKSAAAKMDKTKPLFIISHAPLHARRGDNTYANDWYTAVSAVAANMDVFFFWAHNHTSEKDADRNAFYVQKNGSEQMTIEGGSTVTPNFTYANAGYIAPANKDTERQGVMTAVRIYADTVNLTVYDSNGVYSGSYPLNVEVKRDHAVTHTHSYKSEVTTEATCTTDGVETYTCSCGDYYEKDITATGHSYGEGVVTTEATCTAAGVKTFTCSCGDSYTEAIEATGHEYDEGRTTTEATCTEDGVTTYTCVKCEATSTSAIEASGHNYVDGVCSACSAVDPDYEETTTPTETEPTETTAPATEDPTDEVVKTLSHIDVDGTTAYAIGDVLTFTGITAVYTGSDNNLYYESLMDEDGNLAEGVNYDGDYDMNAAGTYSVTVTYGDASQVYWFTVDEPSSFENNGVTISGVITLGGVTVTEDKTDYSSLVENSCVAYDITPSGIEVEGEGLVTLRPGNYATVTLPLPENLDASSISVHHVTTDDNGNAVLSDEVFDVTVDETAGTLSFRTSHFSTWVVAGSTTPSGGTTDNETPGTDSEGVDYETAEDGSYQKVTLGSDEPQTVYVLVSTPTAGNDYVIASSGSAGSAYALKQNTTTGFSVTVNAATGSITAPWIENPDDTIVWTAYSGLNFNSGSYWLNYSESSDSYSLSFGTRSSSASDWTAGTNTLYRNGQRNDYYLRCSNGTWTMGSSGSTYNVYFYEKQTLTVDSSVTYEVVASDIEHIYDSDDTTAETATITYELQANGETKNFDGEVWTLAVVSDPSGIIASTSGDTITFSGKEGTAQVRVYYTVGEYKVWTTINVTTTDPYYSMQIHYATLTEATGISEFAEGTTYYTYNSTTGTYEVATKYVSGTTYYTTPVAAGEEITAPVALKGIEAGDNYAVWAIIKEHTSANPDGSDIGTVKDPYSIAYEVSNTNIATVDASTGVLTFTGNEYGTFELTVRYLDEDGKVLCEDTITISVTESLYIVPGDGTDDFPEYPNQGAIRIDKTATAVGNFSETGMAMVELSMTGVPYGTSTATDVVVMVDMTSSMEDNDITAAKLAVQELIETLVYDEENDVYDENIHLFVSSFSSGTSTSNIVITDHLYDVTIGSDEKLTDAKSQITDSTDGFRDDRHSTNGTHYGVALADVYATLNRDGHSENQFVVFVTDGVPTNYFYLNSSGSYSTESGSNSDTNSLANGWFDDDGEVTTSFQTEYYTYLIKTAGIPVYTVGANLTSGSDASDLINHMSSNYSPDGKTSTGETKYSFTCTTSGGITDEVLAIFQGIGQDIKEAATNVEVVDEIGSDYTLTFKLPNSGVTAEEAGMSQFYIQVVGYELDENHERKDNPTVLEKFLFNKDGTLASHTVGATTCSDCTHVTFTDGVVTAIDGTYFDYSTTTATDEDGNTYTKEFLTWTAEKLDTTELALQYFVYLDNSAGDVAATDQVPAGTYYTNEKATITYTNYKGNQVQKEFPVPQMTWNGAQVTYVFYLVNEDGQPVNRAGKIIPFAESVYVTDPVTYSVTWNEMEGQEKMMAKDLLAFANVPDVYTLYDLNAYYEILVYQTEGGYYNTDNEFVETENYSHFIIEGSTANTYNDKAELDVTNLETTKVFNTKSGTRYDDYGAYSATAGTYTSTKSNTSYKATVTNNFDYANTTVAFAVVWKDKLVEDTVVIDFGLDVVIDVTINDALNTTAVGVRSEAPEGIEINKGQYKAAKENTADVYIDTDGDDEKETKIGTASTITGNTTSVKFSLDKDNGMQFKVPAVFYYESDVLFYTYDNAGTASPVNTSLYSSVTVIPATTVYYEDEYVDLTYFVKGDDGNYTSNAGWDVNSVHASAIQDTDRPGEGKISELYDAENKYGYDSAYETMSQYSMGSAAMVHVDANSYATAEFTFYGTGFDVIGLTSNTTGYLAFEVKDAEGTSVMKKLVNTYYGYTYENGEWILDNSGENALYQVPVLEAAGLTYGKYHVTITATYNSYFDKTAADGYDLYLDAIRIYDPTGVASGSVTNTTVSDAYEADGEGWPEYTELRNQIIDAATFNSLGSDNSTIDGIVFIDGISEVGDKQIANYVSYGPNNELYLASSHAVAFYLDAFATNGSVKSVQLAIKTVGGTGSVQVYSVDSDGNVIKMAVDQEISSATDMYYDITALNNNTVVIKNSGDSDDAIVSLTNIKVTYDEAQTTGEETEPTAFSLLTVSRSTASYALMSLSAEDEDVEVEETEPETTVPEDNETETTVPEDTTPETTVPEEDEETEPETETETETTVPEETEPEETEPKNDTQETIVNVLTTIVNKITNALSNLFSKWFR